jgi:hypothetical protein
MVSAEQVARGQGQEQGYRESKDFSQNIAAHLKSIRVRSLKTSGKAKFTHTLLTLQGRGH